MTIDRTGNARIDQATAELAVALRDADPGKRDQHYYDEAMRLRNEIMVGTLEREGTLPAWTPANNGTSKRRWFLIRGHGVDSERVPLRARYHNGPSGDLVRYASFETAQRAADKLNGEEMNLSAYLAAKAASERLTAEWVSSGYKPGDPAPQYVRDAEARVGAMKRAAGEGGPDEPLCCQRYGRLHEPAFSVAGCRWGRVAA
jgi:hypothetical protein